VKVWIATWVVALGIAACSDGPTQPENEVLIQTPGGAENVMVIVPEGEFRMGSETGGPDESPEHTVFLSEYLIEIFEVANQKFVRFLNAIGRHESNDGPFVYLDNPDIQIFQRNDIYQVDPSLPESPVVEVAWFGANAYCVWIGGRLPTEAEWEKGARGTDLRRYPWGNEIPDNELLNYNGNINRTADVGSHPEGASAYGTMDVAGNVWEWTNDHYDQDYYAISPRDNPKGPSEGELRSIRGGSFGSPAVNV